MIEPWGARLVQQEEFERMLSVMLQSHGYAERIAATIDRNLAKKNRDNAERVRELRWTIRPGDKVWMLSEPPEHREFIEGTMSLVVVRNGTVVARHCIYSG